MAECKPDGPPDFGIDRSACPEWNDDPEKVDAILEWANASVEWSDTFVSPKRGGGEDEVVRTRRPKLAHWSMVWRPGFIGFMSVREDTPKDRSRARAASALFIHLWCKRVDAAISAHCAEAYVNYYECHFEEQGEPENTELAVEIEVPDGVSEEEVIRVVLRNSTHT